MINIINMKKSPVPHPFTLTSEAVCAKLGISPATLYAYVSRGQIRATQQAGDGRRSLYDERDVRALSERKRVGRSRRDVASSTIDWGEPVLTSSITQIIDGQFYYRGTQAIALARSHTLESVASKLVRAPMQGASTYLPAFVAPEHPHAFQRILNAFSDNVVAGLSAGGRQDAGRLLRIAALSAAGTRDTDGLPIHQLLARAWTQDKSAPDILRMATILCADHELNASTYAARVAASAGASTQACILAGLATLSGSEHGGITEICGAWMAKVEQASNPQRLIRTRLRRGGLPGFGHHLYPDGDPRAAMIIATVDLPARWGLVVDIAQQEANLHPSLDFGLALIERQLDMPKGAGLAMFAVGRTAGWIAHILEQRRTGRLIRPRAAYEPATAEPEEQA